MSEKWVRMNRQRHEREKTLDIQKKKMMRSIVSLIYRMHLRQLLFLFIVVTVDFSVLPDLQPLRLGLILEFL
jgi:hypothetical protein